MRYLLLVSAAWVLCASPAAAQEATDPPTDAATVFDGDWLNVGVGGLYSPSYDGSDDYVVTILPLVQGKLGGVSINPRPAGLALDFIPDPDTGVGFALGPSVRLRSNRAVQVKDPVVLAAGKLRRAIEVGVAAGVSLPQLLNPYDRLSLTLDARWDVNKAHRGMVLAPAVSYFTPLSRGTGVVLTLDAERGDDDFMRYYYSVTPAQSVASGLPVFAAKNGWTRAGVTAIGAIDFDGNLTNGGLSAVVLGGYSRMLGDAKRSPYTSQRGSADQWLAGVGLGLTF
ncbi:MAG TPA: MipA/OmpV family protein [Novosphingobium sp.]|nr:MipA/OmpV family protein [Novosphingobium sp.]